VVVLGLGIANKNFLSNERSTETRARTSTDDDMDDTLIGSCIVTALRPLPLCFIQNIAHSELRE
jgi:hypothetical protein